MIKSINSASQLRQAFTYAILASTVISSVLFASYLIAEPSISYGQAVDTGEFRIRQTILDETSFSTAPTNVDMAGDINGVTGGNATGTTQFVVKTNNTAGYYVEISFEDNGTPEAMLGDESLSESIRDYDGDLGGQPSRGFTASTAAQFAYTVTSSSSLDTDLSFFHDGATCNAAGSQALTCWKSPAVAGFRIIDTSAAALTGATSTIKFNVNVPSSAVPVPEAETYTATATLSLFVK